MADKLSLKTHIVDVNLDVNSYTSEILNNTGRNSLIRQPLTYFTDSHLRQPVHDNERMGARLFDNETPGYLYIVVFKIGNTSLATPDLVQHKYPPA